MRTFTKRSRILLSMQYEVNRLLYCIAMHILKEKNNGNTSGIYASERDQIADLVYSTSFKAVLACVVYSYRTFYKFQ